MRVIRSAVVSLAVPLAALVLAGLPAPVQAALPAPPPPTQDYGAALQRARAAVMAEDFAAALASLDQAIRLDPGAPAAFAMLGQTLLRLERYAEASDALSRAGMLAGGIRTQEGISILQLLALSLARQEENAEALALLTRLVEARPDRRAIRLLRGNVLLALGRPEPARLDFQQEIALHTEGGPGGGGPVAPHSPLAAAWEGLGICAYRLGDDASALDALGRVPAEPEARYHLGLTLARMERHEEAFAAFGQVLAGDPKHRGALQGLARSAGSLGRAGERARALSALESLYRQDEQSRSAKNKVSLHRTRAVTRAAAGELREASAELEQAVSLAPDDLALRLDFGRSLSMAGDPRRAEEVLRALIARDPMYADAHHQLGRLLLEAGDPAAAAPLETACRISPTNAAFHVALGQARLAAGRVDEGVRELRLSRELAPSDHENAYLLGLGLAQAGELKAAVEELRSAASLDASDPRPHEALAELYARLGDAERSRREQDISRRLKSRANRPT